MPATVPIVPDVLRKQSVLSAVFRVGPSNDVTGTPTEYALRLLVEPPRATRAVRAAPALHSNRLSPFG